MGIGADNLFLILVWLAALCLPLAVGACVGELIARRRWTRRLGRSFMRDRR